jgi:hypothetical protein
VGGLPQKVLSGSKLEILHGTGAGQERTITLQSETIHDSGVVTGATTSTLSDSTKKWRPNQWAGYTVGITFGTDATHYKKIVYNDSTTLYAVDQNLMPQDPWNTNNLYASAVPYVIPTATAGVQSHYVILSQTYTTDTNWTTTPNATSFCTTQTGGIWLLTSGNSQPFMQLLYYDVAAGAWVAKTVAQNLTNAALGTDFSIDRVNRLGSALATKVGTVSGGARTLTDSGLTLAADRFANYRIVITGGTGIGQNRRIVGNTATVFTVERPWATQPDSTSTYEVWPDFDRIWLVGNACSAMQAYSPENDVWMQGQLFDDGVAVNIAATYGSYKPFAINTGTRIAAAVTAINSSPTAGGSGYVVGDQLTCSVGGTGCIVLVTGVSTTGAVTSLELLHCGSGSGFTTGTGKATTGGTGTGCTIEITSVGVCGVLVLRTSHWLRAGDSITVTGCSESAWNATYSVLCVPTISAVCVVLTATANAAASNSQGTTTIVDASKNWTTNEHVGRLVHLCVAGPTPTSQVRWITANTATTLTVATITGAGDGTSKYAIYDAKAFGVDVQRRPATEAPYGYATSGTTTSLTDSSKNWVVNQWAGYLFKVEAGTGYGSGRISITSNTATTLNFATQTFTPDATTKYEIADSWGLCTGGSTTTAIETTTKNWTTNQWAGKRMRFTAGTPVGWETGISSNTNNTLTFTALSVAADTTSVYAIYGIPVRSTGTELLWAWGGSDAARKGRYIISARGGGTNQFDIYDVTTGRWTYGQFFPHHALLPQTGSSYAYDGVDSLYVTSSANSGPQRVFVIDLPTGNISAFGQTTTLQGTVHISNAMEIVQSPDGVKYLYIWHNSSSQIVRAMIF